MSATSSEALASAALDAAPKRTILGVDPGLLRTGYAVLGIGTQTDQAPRLLEAGLVRLSPRHSLARRLGELDAALGAITEAHRPAVLACEELYAHYKHPRTAILMGHARGVVLALAARHGLEVLSIAATHAKKLLTGSGRAGKPQVQRAVAATFGLLEPPEPHDVADAVAIALAGVRLSETLPAAGRPWRAVQR